MEDEHDSAFEKKDEPLKNQKRSFIFQRHAHLSFSNLLSCHLPTFWVI
jgi:hypothetical protein